MAGQFGHLGRWQGNQMNKTVEKKARAVRLRAQKLRNNTEYRRSLKATLEKIAAVLDA